MIAIVLRAVLLSLDTLVVSFALGPMIPSRRQRCAWAALFGLCDGLATLVGFAAGGHVWNGSLAQLAPPILALALAVYCLLASCWNKFRANPRLALGLPILLSLDNLAYGAGVQSSSQGLAAQAALFGLASFAAAGLGLMAGGLTQSTEPQARERFTGFALAVASIVLFFS